MDKASRAVFCDFDGTITAEESLEAVLKTFNPEVYEPVMADMRAGKTTIREGVRQMVEGIPSRRYPEILAFVRGIPIREGFEELLDFLDQQNIPFIILSGGLRDMVETRLGALAGRADRIFAADIDASGPFLKLSSDFAGGHELVAKAEVIGGLGVGESIVIGDGITDLEMAKSADIVFARNSLAGYLERIGITFHRWEDFYDIRNELKKLL
jgi:2-hydroxy-3-keto-5-methylthiopentenyl-1-phosphate phosphatase